MPIWGVLCIKRFYRPIWGVTVRPVSVVHRPIWGVKAYIGVYRSI